MLKIIDIMLAPPSIQGTRIDRLQPGDSSLQCL